MKLLAIDTATSKASVCLALGTETRTLEQPFQREHARYILPLIDELLREAQLSIAELDGIVFGRGPGSFTGLRIACSIAKGLAFAHDLPVYPVSDLLAITRATQSLNTASLPILAMMDARMNQLYWSLWRHNYPLVEHLNDAQDIHLTTGKMILAGVGYEAYLGQFPAVLRENVLEYREVYPQAQTLCTLVQEQHIQAISAAEALPIYIRNQVTHSGGKNG